MTGEEFKAWRESKGLSQQDAADLVGASSRFVVMRWEAGSEMPTTIQARIIEAEAVLAATPKGEKPKRAKGLKGQGIPSEVVLDMSGKRQRYEWTRTCKLGQCYWKYDWIDKSNGHHMFNLYQVGHDHDETIRGLCTPIRLDVNTWHVRADFMFDADNVLATAEKLDNHMAPARANPPQSLDDCISKNDVFFGVQGSTVDNENMFQ